MLKYDQAAYFVLLLSKLGAASCS